MKGLEPDIMAIMTMEAKSTVEVMDTILAGRAEWEKASNRTRIYGVLRALEKKEMVEGRTCIIDPHRPPIKFWALPGGTFPEGIQRATLTVRVREALTDGPMTMDALSEAVFDDVERDDDKLRRILKRMARNRQIVADGDTWRLE